ncbi:MAG: hypothetical protein EA402_14390 [Planctomycetota bacterium]|nr:MAG: hypothetical protein EA402_14390 [Planctomycetota bacterium]
MTPDDIVSALVSSLCDVVPKASWGETALFYNRGRQLPNGVYFCTIKDHDGANDRASHLDRQGIFRLAFALDNATYVQYFGAKPPRPAKGCAATSGHDYTKLNQLMPHPVYAWMGWVQVLCPTAEMFSTLQPLIGQAHRTAMASFDKRIGRQKRSRQ